MNDHQLIARHLAYSQETGVFTWRTSTRGHRAGAIAGSVHAGHGYVSISVGGRRFFAHRLAWLVTNGQWPPLGIDHINGNRSDNRISNLRLATRSENQQNLRGPMRNNAAGVLGVCLVKSGKFQAQITVDGRQQYLGLHPTPEAASGVYLAAKAQQHPYQTIVARGPQ